MRGAATLLMRRLLRALTGTLALGAALAAVAQEPGTAIEDRGLPRPGYAPDHIAYPFDRIGERLELLFTLAGEETLLLSLAFAREKLAEALAMVAAAEAGFAWIAVGLYEDYLERAAAAVDDAAPAERDRLRLHFVRAMAAHVHALAQRYGALPPDVRVFALLPLLNAALYELDRQRAAMPAPGREALAPTDAVLATDLQAMRAADGGAAARGLPAQ